MEVRGEIKVIAGNGVGILIDKDWYTVDKEVVNTLHKGDKVILEVEKKGIYLRATKVTKVDATTKTETPSAYVCEVCGVALKDGKYKKCYKCYDGKKGNTVTKAKEEAVKEEPKPAEQKTTYIPKAGGYGSPEDTLGKEIGCAAGCASQILAGSQDDILTILERWSDLFQGILERMRTAKGL